MFQQLRHERERAGVVGGRVFRLALRLKNPAEIIARLGMIGVDRQHALVGPHGIIEFPRALVRYGLEQVLPDLFAEIGRVRRNRRAELHRGAALLSVHRPVSSFAVRFLKFSRCVEIQICCLTTLGGFYTAFPHAETWPSG